MDFSRIDEIVHSNYSVNQSNEQVEDKLDTYDLNRLRSIYHRVTGKCPDLLKRHHLCQEILKSFQVWQNTRHLSEINKSMKPELIQLSTLLTWEGSSSWKSFKLSLGESFDTENFPFKASCPEQLYRKCADDLLYRCSEFGSHLQDYPELLKLGKFTELFDLYFESVYQNYHEKYRDFLLLVLVGLNHFEYQPVKLDLSIEQSNTIPMIEIIYDEEIPILGYFHLQLPNFQEIDQSTDEKGSTDGKLVMKEPKPEEIKYSRSWIRHSALKFPFTTVDPKSEEQSVREEIFSTFVI